MDKYEELYIFNEDNEEKPMESINSKTLISKEDKYFGFIIVVLLIINFAFGILWYRSLFGKMMITVGLAVTILFKLLRKKLESKTIVFVNLGIIFILTVTVGLGFVDKYKNQLIFSMISIETKLAVGSQGDIYIGAYNRDTPIETSLYYIKSSDKNVIKIVNSQAHIVGEGPVTLTVVDNYRNTISQEFKVEEVRAYDYLVENLKLRVGEETPIQIAMFPYNSTDEEPKTEVVEGFEQYLRIENNVYIPLKPGVAKIRTKHALGDKEFELKIHSNFEQAKIKVLDSFETVTSSDGSVLHYLANPGDVIRLGIETIPDEIDPFKIEWTVIRNINIGEKIRNVDSLVLKFEDQMEITLNVQNSNDYGEFIPPETISFMLKGTQ